jgi:hypothetical protein
METLRCRNGVTSQYGILKLRDAQRIKIPIEQRTPEQLGFTASHSIVNYDWIFSTITKGQKGYVETRN